LEKTLIVEPVEGDQGFRVMEVTIKCILDAKKENRIIIGTYWRLWQMSQRAELRTTREWNKKALFVNSHYFFFVLVPSTVTDAQLSQKLSQTFGCPVRLAK
jgi:hypothetical protein